MSRTRILTMVAMLALSTCLTAGCDSESEEQKIERRVRAEYAQKMWMVGGALAVAGLLVGVAMGSRSKSHG